MRRTDREVKDIQEIGGILSQCRTCHLAMVDDGQPYVIPLSYAYEIEEGMLTLYFHSAKVGRKIEILRKNSAVCFEISMEGEPIFEEKTPCNSSYHFSSVHGFGSVQFVEDTEEKCRVLSLFMKHQANVEIAFVKKQVDAVCVYKVVSTDFTGKRKLQ